MGFTSLALKAKANSTKNDYSKAAALQGTLTKSPTASSHFPWKSKSPKVFNSADHLDSDEPARDDLRAASLKLVRTSIKLTKATVLGTVGITQPEDTIRAEVMALYYPATPLGEADRKFAARARLGWQTPQHDVGSTAAATAQAISWDDAAPATVPAPATEVTLAAEPSASQSPPMLTITSC